MSRRGLLASAVFGLSVVVSASASAQQTHLLVVTGLGGDAEFTRQFHSWASTLIEAATTRYEIPADHIAYLGEDPELAPDLIDARSTLENIESAVHALGERAGPDDHVVIVLFGHGSFTDGARINLPRRDLSAEDFGRLLDGLAEQQVTFVNTASASGPFIEELSGSRRTIMTATRTGLERNASVFGGYFVAAFADGESEADQDKDRRVSMLEAFTYARAKTVQSYEAEGLLATEHALLDDNGDGRGTDEPDPLGAEGADGVVARAMFFSNGVGRRADMAFPDDPALQVLYQEQATLVSRVDELRRVRGGVVSEQYERELETLMVELALKGREIRRLEAAKGESQTEGQGRDHSQDHVR